MKKHKKKISSKQKGITLIALVITIIILLILAGISIATLTGENGILTKASTAKEESNKAGAKEKVQLAVMSYQIDKETTTLYDELIKVEGLTYITPDNRNDGPKYNVIVDGYEFVINEDLSIEYVGESKNQIIPEITKVEYETVTVEKLTITIAAKTEDKAGLKEIRVSYKRIEDGKTEYETVKVEKVTGKETNIEVEIPINGEYVIEAIGENNQIGKKEISINNIKEGNILATITAGEVTDKATANLTIRAQSQGITIQAIELYVSDIKVKTYQYNDLETIREETYTINNLEFYKQNDCYIKVFDSNNQETTSIVEPVINTKIILTASDLRNLALEVNNKNNTFQNKVIYLMDNIETGENWKPIGYYDGTDSWIGKYFAGTFEGNKHTITVTSLSKDTTTYHSSGLFGMVIGGTINNLNINGTMDAKCSYIGGISGGIKDGSINNCSNNAIVTDTTGNYHSGIVGIAENSTIQNCTNTNSIYGNSEVGGISGNANNSTTISNCNNSGLIKCYGVSEVVNGNTTTQAGVVGGISANLLYDSTIELCTNTGEITGNAETILPKGIGAGGMAGFIVNSTITTSKNDGMVHFDISSSSIHNSGTLGGIAGEANYSKIEQSFNTGIITAKYNNYYGMNLVGGIVGYMNVSTIKNSYNIGEIYGDAHIGGIVGLSSRDAGLTGNNYIYNSYNASETVMGNSSVGNFLGSCFYTIGAHFSCLANTTWGENGDGCSFENTSLYTLEQMKTPNSDLLTLLSNGDGNGIWAQETGKNGGLPYLVNNQP